MRQLNWQDKCRFWLAKLLIKLGKLTHDAFTISELKELLEPLFPYKHGIDVPYGKGQITLQQGEIKLNQARNRMEVQVFSAMQITLMGNPIYRAHLVIVVSAKPGFTPGTDVLAARDVRVEQIYLVNDEYALLQDSATVLDKLLPVPVSPLIRGPMKDMLSLFSAGMSDEMLNYFKLYLGGSKQRVLDYHKPQLEALLTRLARDNLFEYTLDQQDWRQYLFYHLGKEVVVENNELRFKF